MYISLAFNSLQSAFLCFPTAGIPDVCHQAWQRHFSECCIYIIECICLRWKLMEDEKFTFKPYFFMFITISVKLAKIYFRFNSICRPLRRLTGQRKMTPPLPSPELQDWCKCYSREESTTHCRPCSSEGKGTLPAGNQGIPQSQTEKQNSQKSFTGREKHSLFSEENHQRTKREIVLI